MAGAGNEIPDHRGPPIASKPFIEGPGSVNQQDRRGQWRFLPLTSGID